MPDALLVRCLPRVMQASVNPHGDPQTAVVVIRTNNGRLDECTKLHDLLINHILGDVTMPDDSKPTKPKEQNQPTPNDEVK